MKKFAVLAMSLLVFACSEAVPPNQTASPKAGPAGPTLPFRVEIVEVTPSSLPALHSFVAAQAGGRWLILSGRTAGLHGFNPGPNNFPRSTANTVAYVVDPISNQVLGSIDLAKSLPAVIAGPLTATNAESVQVGNDLFVVGGYGQDLTSNTNTTFGSIVKINVAGLIGAIVSNKPIASYFAQNSRPDNRLRVTGGSLKSANGVFYLAFGQAFMGNYSLDDGDYNKAGGQFQKYTEKVRAFTLNSDLAINTFQEIDGGYDPALPYHRRDLNVVDIIQPDGHTPGATTYGGVFLAGQVGGHLRPIDILFGGVAGTTMSVQTNFSQALNHYDCPTMTIFDPASASSFTTLFGGISQFHYDGAAGTLVRDALNLAIGVDGLPFVNTVSTIQRGPTGVFSQVIQPISMPGLLGTDGQFLVNPDLSGLFPNGVINLGGLSTRILAGVIYGGIEAGGPYAALVPTKPTTWASSRLFNVYVTPGPSTAISMPPLPTTPTPYPPGKAGR